MGVQRKPLSAFSVFQVPAAQGNQYIKVLYLGVAHPELLLSYFEVVSSAIRHLFWIFSKIVPESCSDSML